MATQPWIERVYRLLDSVRVNELSDTYALSVIDEITARARSGEVYHFSHVFTGVVDATNADILIRTGSKRASLRLGASVGAASQFRLYESPTISNAGTAISKVNRNRTVSVTFQSTVFRNPTVSNVGTLLVVDYLPGGVKNKEVGSTSPEIPIWILADNTDYLLRMTNISGGAEDIGFFGDVFEDVI